MSVLPALSITCCVSLSLSPSGAQLGRMSARESQREKEERERECERESGSGSLRQHVRTSGTAVTISGISGWALKCNIYVVCCMFGHVCT